MRFHQFIDKFVISSKVIFKTKNWPQYFLSFLGFGISKIITRDGQILELRPNSIDRWIATENIILDEYRLCNLKQKFLPKTIVDVGANIGAFAIQAKHLFPKCKIICIEPDSQNLVLLNKNLKTNSIKAMVIPAALGQSGDIKLKLYQNENSATRSVVYKSNSYEVVNTIDFPKLSKMVKAPALMKMDIEGQEYKLITAKYQKYLRMFDYIVLETHDSSPKRSGDQIIKKLKQIGFATKKQQRIIIAKRLGTK